VGRRPSCRALVLFANLSPVVLKFRTPWHDWTDDVRGQPIDCGHHIAEEAPDELANLLAEFFTQPQSPAYRREHGCAARDADGFQERK
jgi:haloacetate dehalogenase